MRRCGCPSGEVDARRSGWASGSRTGNGPDNQTEGEEACILIDVIAARIQNAWFAARDEESGQALVEYALIVSLIALVAIGAVTLLGDNIKGIFEDAASSIPGP